MKNFTRISNSLIRHRNMDPNEKVVLFILLSFNPSRPTLNQIAQQSNLSLKTLRRVLKKLKTDNILSWISGKRGVANVYKLVDPKFWNRKSDDTLEGNSVHEVRGILTPPIRLIITKEIYRWMKDNAISKDQVPKNKIPLLVAYYEWDTKGIVPNEFLEWSGKDIETLKQMTTNEVRKLLKSHFESTQIKK